MSWPIPLWKSILGYPGYCADPRIVLGLNVYIIPVDTYKYVCHSLYPYGKVSQDTRDTVPILGLYWDSVYTHY